MGFLDFLFPGRKPDVDKFFQKANEERKKAQFGDAIKLFDKVLQVEPLQVKALLGKGSCLMGKGKFQSALEVFEKIIQIDPQNPNAWYDKGIALKNLGRREEGEECMRKGESLKHGVPKDDLGRPL